MLRAMLVSEVGSGTLIVRARLRYPGRPDAEAMVTILKRDRGQRLAGVVKVWALSWLAAVAAVFLPVLHFVLVPALLIGGPLYALALRHEHSTLLRVEGECPACGAAVADAHRRRAAERVPLRCDGCGRAIEVVVEPAMLAPPVERRA